MALLTRRRRRTGPGRNEGTAEMKSSSRLRRPAHGSESGPFLINLLGYGLETPERLGVIVFGLRHLQLQSLDPLLLDHQFILELFFLFEA